MAASRRAVSYRSGRGPARTRHRRARVRARVRARGPCPRSVPAARARLARRSAARTCCSGGPGSVGGPSWHLPSSGRTQVRPCVLRCCGLCDRPEPMFGGAPALESPAPGPELTITAGSPPLQVPERVIIGRPDPPRVPRPTIIGPPDPPRVPRRRSSRSAPGRPPQDDLSPPPAPLAAAPPRGRRARSGTTPPRRPRATGPSRRAGRGTPRRPRPARSTR